MIKLGRRYNLKKSEDVVSAFWDDGLIGDRQQVLHETVKLDKQKGQLNYEHKTTSRNSKPVC